MDSTGDRFEIRPPYDPMKFYSAFEFRPIRARDVRSGDLLANQATVSRVIIGPKTAKQVSDEWLRPAKGEVTIRCGADWSSKGPADRVVIVGRNRNWGWPS